MNYCPTCQNKEVRDFCEIRKWIYKECSRCKCLFLVDYKSKTELDSYYENEFSYELTPEAKFRIKASSKRIVSKLASLNSSGKNLLDIGSGHGYLLNEAQNEGFDALGIEPSKTLYNKTKKKLSVENVDINNFIKHSERKFDFITLIHVIEHLVEPNAIADQLDKMLNLNGIVLIETPNYNSWLRFVEKCEYTFLTPPDHLYVFSEKTIRCIFEKKSWEILSIETYSYPEHFIGILLKLKARILNFGRKYSNSTNPKSEFKKNNFQIKKNILLEFLAPFLTPSLNWRNYGSIIQIYLKKT